VCLLLLLAASAQPATARSRTDPLRSRQWGLDQVRAPQAWQVTRGRGVVVAVADTGVDYGHPDLRGALLPGKDYTGTGVADGCGHGTEVVGVIAARRNNGIGISGVAPESRVLPLKDGSGCSVDFTKTMLAIRWAADHGARVVNISSATQPVAGDVVFRLTLADEMQAAIDYAWTRGTLVVAGAGNSVIPICTYPAALEHVICVGALDEAGERAYYSQGEVRDSVDFLMAPGGGFETELIWTTTGDVMGLTGRTGERGYAQVEGTSFASPFVSGVAALLFSRGMSVQEVHDRLLSTARDLGLPGRDPVYGWGEVDAAAALGLR
jgi:subtilisin family serine protease